MKKPPNYVSLTATEIQFTFRAWCDQVRELVKLAGEQNDRYLQLRGELDHGDRAAKDEEDRQKEREYRETCRAIRRQHRLHAVAQLRTRSWQDKLFTTPESFRFRRRTFLKEAEAAAQRQYPVSPRFQLPNPRVNTDIEEVFLTESGRYGRFGWVWEPIQQLIEQAVVRPHGLFQVAVVYLDELTHVKEHIADLKARIDRWTQQADAAEREVAKRRESS